MRIRVYGRINKPIRTEDFVVIQFEDEVHVERALYPTTEGRIFDKLVSVKNIEVKFDIQFSYF